MDRQKVSHRVIISEFLDVHSCFQGFDDKWFQTSYCTKELTELLSPKEKENEREKVEESKDHDVGAFWRIDDASEATKVL